MYPLYESLNQAAIPAYSSSAAAASEGLLGKQQQPLVSVTHEELVGYTHAAVHLNRFMAQRDRVLGYESAGAGDLSTPAFRLA